MTRFRTSIALATFQSARFLKQQLDSYLAQTRLPDELIVSDDHSTDGTQAIVADFKGEAPFPVTLVPNPGTRRIVWNFENAVRHCKGDIILFSDHDDVWLPNHVEKLAGILEADERILAVSSNSEVVDEELNRKGYTFEQSERYPRKLHEAVMRFPKNQLELIARQRMLAGHGLAFRQSMVTLVLPFSPECLHDCWVYVLAAAVGRVAYVSEPLTLYRTHGKQTIGGERKPLQAIAISMGKQSAAVDEAHSWQAILERVREFPQLAVDPDYSLQLLKEKLEFVKRRAQNRRLGLPARLSNVTQELIRRRYHRLGRGFTTFARDLYGNR